MSEARLDDELPSCQQRMRPARPGCSISFHLPDAPPELHCAGTLGAVVRLDDGRIGMLSNNHVLANAGVLPIGTPICQPGTFDQGTVPWDRIGVLTRIAPLQEGSDLDCAVATADREGDIMARCLGPIAVTSGEPIVAYEGMRVWKFGRSTQLTEGVVTDVGFVAKMRYEVAALVEGEYQLSTHRVVFRNQIRIVSVDAKPFSDDGDSGALIIDLGTGRPTGLLCGGTGTIAVANHLAPVLKHLKVEVVIA